MERSVITLSTRNQREVGNLGELDLPEEKLQSHALSKRTWRGKVGRFASSPTFPLVGEGAARHPFPFEGGFLCGKFLLKGKGKKGWVPFWGVGKGGLGKLEVGRGLGKKEIRKRKIRNRASGNYLLSPARARSAWAEQKKKIGPFEGLKRWFWCTSGGLLN